MEELMTKLNELAPDVVEQMLAWGAFCNWIGIVVCSLLLLGYGGLWWVGLKKDWDEDTAIPIWGVGGLFALLAIGILVKSIATLCQIHYWPYAYILDKLT